MLETSTEHHTAEALMAAFQRGAGVQPNWQLTPEFMEMLGKLVGTSISGAHSLLLNRAELKRNIHADATVVVVRSRSSRGMRSAARASRSATSTRSSSLVT